MTSELSQIRFSGADRGIADHFYCFVCGEHVLDCAHLVDDRLTAPRLPALPGSQLESFAYDGCNRLLEIEFRIAPPYTSAYARPIPPPRIIQYRNVPRYVFTTLTRYKTARRQERYWYDFIQRKYQCQTVRTLCRLPRIYRLSEARNIRPFAFEEFVAKMPEPDRQSFRLSVEAMKVLLLCLLAPVRVTGLGGLFECQCCRKVGADTQAIQHVNSLWWQLS